MPIRTPSEPERQGLIELRQEELYRSDGRGLSKSLVFLVVAGLAAVAVIVARLA